MPLAAAESDTLWAVIPAAWHIDHVFVLVAPGAPEAALLERAGLVPGARREHAGQGTANVCFCFANAYLELLFITNEAQLRSPPVATTRLWERSRWRESGASPFGVCLRGPGDPPVPTSQYAAPFLPQGHSIPIATDEDSPLAPMLFFAAFPPAPPPEFANPQRLIRITIETPVVPAWYREVSREVPMLELVPSGHHSMSIEVDHSHGRRLTLESLPLTINW
ncbi:hypothetical protein PHYC_01735 [Phycisphaerales bacterium]|nr:hypothetical protein PHYC_01735 [Phycisphaerales bacterium]